MGREKHIFAVRLIIARYSFVSLKDVLKSKFIKTELENPEFCGKI